MGRCLCAPLLTARQRKTCKQTAPVWNPSAKCATHMMVSVHGHSILCDVESIMVVFRLPSQAPSICAKWLCISPAR